MFQAYAHRRRISSIYYAQKKQSEKEFSSISFQFESFFFLSFFLHSTMIIRFGVYAMPCGSVCLRSAKTNKKVYFTFTLDESSLSLYISSVLEVCVFFVLRFLTQNEIPIIWWVYGTKQKTLAKCIYSISARAHTAHSAIDENRWKMSWWQKQ